MSDFLLQLSKNKAARRVVRSLPLPIPLPEALRRDSGPLGDRPLADRAVAIGFADGAELAALLASTLGAAGADPYLAGEAHVPAFRDAGEAYGRPARPIDALGSRAFDALVLDATGVRDVPGLRALFTFFNGHGQRLARSGHAVVLVRMRRDASADEQAARAAVTAFMKSLAKEIGRKGCTANIVEVEDGADARLGGVLRFLLSGRAAFVTGQPIRVSSLASFAEERVVHGPRLERRVALVTGAARGIGEATVRRLAQEGAHVVCRDRPSDSSATTQLARSIGGTPLHVDQTEADAPAMVADALRSFGGVDVVVLNAGITKDRTLAKMSVEDWDRVLEVNLASAIRLVRALEPLLRTGGRIIGMASIAGIAGNVGQTAYAASKAGFSGLARGLAPALAARGITVNAIAPGFIETRLTAAIPVAVREVARRLSALGQGGIPDDVASLVAFLASGDAQGITGQTVRVCGGSFVGA
ncbi:MAG: 3-oxoacyl-ACP reductase [Polyangiaceae bacterium]|nr:3-oxoacyl-ACP reductase [Polyangiaceae bacterium]